MHPLFGVTLNVTSGKSVSQFTGAAPDSPAIATNRAAAASALKFPKPNIEISPLLEGTFPTHSCHLYATFLEDPQTNPQLPLLIASSDCAAFYAHLPLAYVQQQSSPIVSAAETSGESAHASGARANESAHL
jgi:hypothetical protein